MNFGNKSKKHWILFLLLFIPVMYLFTGPMIATVLSKIDSVAAALNFAPIVFGLIFGVVIAAAIFWFIVDRASKADHGISEEEAYYYYDYPDDN